MSPVYFVTHVSGKNPPHRVSGTSVLVRKYKYPPEKTEEAISLVLEQAETISEAWVS